MKDRLGILFVLALFVLAYLGGKYGELIEHWEDQE